MKLTEQQIQFMIEDMSLELLMILMQDYKMDMSKAMDTLYNSETFERLSNINTGLYYQSPGYVYDFLKNELNSDHSVSQTGIKA